MKRFAAAICVMFVLLLMVPWTASAQEEASRITQKALRGVANTTLGLIVDWPKTIYYESRDQGIGHGLTVGFLKGLGLGITRTLVGIYELVTFPIPYPKGYRSILRPDYPFEPGETDLAEG